MEKLFFLPNFFHETNHLLIEDSNLYSEVGTRKRTKKEKENKSSEEYKQKFIC